MKKFFFTIIFVFVACTNSHDSRSDEPKNNNPPSNPPSYNSPPSAPVADNSANQEKEKAKEPVEEDARHEILVIFSEDGTPIRCWKETDVRFETDRLNIRVNKNGWLRLEGFKYFYAAKNGKTIKSQQIILRDFGFTRLDCCLINKRQLNNLTGKFEMTAGRLARAKKECAATLQKEEDDLKKVKAEEEDEKEQDETDEPDDD